MASGWCGVGEEVDGGVTHDTLCFALQVVCKSAPCGETISLFDPLKDPAGEDKDDAFSI